MVYTDDYIDALYEAQLLREFLGEEYEIKIYN